MESRKRECLAQKKKLSGFKSEEWKKNGWSKRCTGLKREPLDGEMFKISSQNNVIIRKRGDQEK